VRLFWLLGRAGCCGRCGPPETSLAQADNEADLDSRFVLCPSAGQPYTDKSLVLRLGHVPLEPLGCQESAPCNTPYTLRPGARQTATHQSRYATLHRCTSWSPCSSPRRPGPPCQRPTCRPCSTGAGPCSTGNAPRRARGARPPRVRGQVTPPESSAGRLPATARPLQYGTVRFDSLVRLLDQPPFLGDRLLGDRALVGFEGK
jgi:hypothetical protein